MATIGLRDLSEIGNCTMLMAEIDDCVNKGDCSPSGYFDLFCDTSMNADGRLFSGVCTHAGMIEVTSAYPYASGVSMISPSPDWFVGFSSVNLCQQDDVTGAFSWIDRYPSDRQQNIYVNDAGTDGGVTFESEDQRLNPSVPIVVFDTPDASNIFYNREAGRLYPVCRLILERMS